jgi:hypothetical protein
MDCSAHDDQLDAIIDQLDAVRHVLIEATATFCRDGHDLDHYADGSPVRSRLELEKATSTNTVGTLTAIIASTGPARS